MGEANLADAEIFAFDEEWRLVGVTRSVLFQPNARFTTFC